VQAGIAQRAAADRQVEALADQVAQLVVQHQVGAQLRVQAQEAGQRRRDHHGAVVGRRGEAQRAARQLAPGADALDRCLRLGQDAHAVLVEGRAGLGQRHPPRAAHQQRRAQLALQPRQVLAHHRLGQAQLRGRRGERAGPHHRGEHRQPVEVDLAAHGPSFVNRNLTMNYPWVRLSIQ
jgi:hypothetical protein